MSFYSASPTEPFQTPASYPSWLSSPWSGPSAAVPRAASKERSEFEDFEEYKADVLSHMKRQELRLRPSPDYINLQPELDWNARFRLLNELVDIHKHFGLNQETLFLAVNYIDRFLSVQTIRADDMPLVGVVALFIAAKMEDTKYPRLYELAMCTKSAGISEARIVEGEKIVLQRLGFELGAPGPGAYFGWAQVGEEIDRDIHLLSSYFLEVTMMDELLIGYPPSLLAAAALNVSRTVSEKGHWTERLALIYGYQAAQLDCPSCLIWLSCHNAHIFHPAVYEKYRNETLGAVSLRVQEIVEMERVGKRNINLLSTQNSVTTLQKQREHGGVWAGA